MIINKLNNIMDVVWGTIIPHINSCVVNSSVSKRAEMWEMLDEKKRHEEKMKLLDIICPLKDAYLDDIRMYKVYIDSEDEEMQVMAKLCIIMANQTAEIYNDIIRDNYFAVKSLPRDMCDPLKYYDDAELNKLNIYDKEACFGAKELWEYMDEAKRRHAEIYYLIDSRDDDDDTTPQPSSEKGFDFLLTLQVRKRQDRHFMSHDVRRWNSLDIRTKAAAIKEIVENCNSLKYYYSANVLMFKEFIGSDDKEKQALAQLANARVNHTATMYSAYLLNIRPSWNDLPDDISQSRVLKGFENNELRTMLNKELLFSSLQRAGII